MNKEELLDFLLELEVIRFREIQTPRKPGHGPCCTCQHCGRFYDECVCGDNEILEAIERKFSD